MINLLLFGLIFCDIKGEVKKPGVYQVDNVNIQDVISMAGGVTKNADTSRINLSKIVIDEMVIYIPNKKEKEIVKVCNCQVTNNQCLKQTTTTTSKATTLLTTSMTTTKPLITTTKEVLMVNINIALVEELVKLNGIGNAIAQRILDYREEKPFEKIEDILNVKGIGENIFAQIKDFITV